MFLASSPTWNDWKRNSIKQELKVLAVLLPFFAAVSEHFGWCYIDAVSWFAG